MERWKESFRKGMELRGEEQISALKLWLQQQERNTGDREASGARARAVMRRLRMRGDVEEGVRAQLIAFAARQAHFAAGSVAGYVARVLWEQQRSERLAAARSAMLEGLRHLWRPQPTRVPPAGASSTSSPAFTSIRLRGRVDLHEVVTALYSLGVTGGGRAASQTVRSSALRLLGELLAHYSAGIRDTFLVGVPLALLALLRTQYQSRKPELKLIAAALHACDPLLVQCRSGSSTSSVCSDVQWEEESLRELFKYVFLLGLDPPEYVSTYELPLACLTLASRHAYRWKELLCSHMGPVLDRLVHYATHSNPRLQHRSSGALQACLRAISVELSLGSLSADAAYAQYGQLLRRFWPMADESLPLLDRRVGVQALGALAAALAKFSGADQLVRVLERVQTVGLACEDEDAAVSLLPAVLSASAVLLAQLPHDRIGDSHEASCERLVLMQCRLWPRLYRGTQSTRAVAALVRLFAATYPLHPIWPLFLRRTLSRALDLLSARAEPHSSLRAVGWRGGGVQSSTVSRLESVERLARALACPRLLWLEGDALGLPGFVAKRDGPAMVQQHVHGFLDSVADAVAGLDLDYSAVPVRWADGSVQTEVVPTCAADQDALLRWTRLARSVLPVLPTALVEARMGEDLGRWIAYARLRPSVSALVALVAVWTEVCGERALRSFGPELPGYVAEVARRGQGMADELLAACAELMLRVPRAVGPALADRRLFLEVALRQPPLESLAVRALVRWRDECPHEFLEWMPSLHPSLDAYLRSGSLSLPNRPEWTKEDEERKGQRAKKKTFPKSSVEELEARDVGKAADKPVQDEEEVEEDEDEDEDQDDDEEPEEETWMESMEEEEEFYGEEEGFEGTGASGREDVLESSSNKVEDGSGGYYPSESYRESRSFFYEFRREGEGVSSREDGGWFQELERPIRLVNMMPEDLSDRRSPPAEENRQRIAVAIVGVVGSVSTSSPSSRGRTVLLQSLDGPRLAIQGVPGGLVSLEAYLPMLAELADSLDGPLHVATAEAVHAWTVACVALAASQPSAVRSSLRTLLPLVVRLAGDAHPVVRRLHAALLAPLSRVASLAEPLQTALWAALRTDRGGAVRSAAAAALAGLLFRSHAIRLHGLRRLHELARSSDPLQRMGALETVGHLLDELLREEDGASALDCLPELVHVCAAAVAAAEEGPDDGSRSRLAQATKALADRSLEERGRLLRPSDPASCLASGLESWVRQILRLAATTSRQDAAVDALLSCAQLFHSWILPPLPLDFFLQWMRSVFSSSPLSLDQEMGEEKNTTIQRWDCWSRVIGMANRWSQGNLEWMRTHVRQLPELRKVWREVVLEGLDVGADDDHDEKKGRPWSERRLRASAARVYVQWVGSGGVADEELDKEVRESMVRATAHALLHPGTYAADDPALAEALVQSARRLVERGDRTWLVLVQRHLQKVLARLQGPTSRECAEALRRRSSRLSQAVLGLLGVSLPSLRQEQAALARAVLNIQRQHTDLDLCREIRSLTVRMAPLPLSLPDLLSPPFLPDSWVLEFQSFLLFSWELVYSSLKKKNFIPMGDSSTLEKTVDSTPQKPTTLVDTFNTNEETSLVDIQHYLEWSNRPQWGEWTERLVEQAGEGAAAEALVVHGEALADRVQEPARKVVVLRRLFELAAALEIAQVEPLVRAAEALSAWRDQHLRARWVLAATACVSVPAALLERAQSLLRRWVVQRVPPNAADAATEAERRAALAVAVDALAQGGAEALAAVEPLLGHEPSRHPLWPGLVLAVRHAAQAASKPAARRRLARWATEQEGHDTLALGVWRRVVAADAQVALPHMRRWLDQAASKGERRVMALLALEAVVQAAPVEALRDEFNRAAAVGDAQQALLKELIRLCLLARADMLQMPCEAASARIGAAALSLLATLLVRTQPKAQLDRLMVAWVVPSEDRVWDYLATLPHSSEFPYLHELNVAISNGSWWKSRTANPTHSLHPNPPDEEERQEDRAEEEEEDESPNGRNEWEEDDMQVKEPSWKEQEHGHEFFPEEEEEEQKEKVLEHQEDYGMEVWNWEMVFGRVVDDWESGEGTEWKRKLVDALVAADGTLREPLVRMVVAKAAAFRAWASTWVPLALQLPAELTPVAVYAAIGTEVLLEAPHCAEALMLVLLDRLDRDFASRGLTARILARIAARLPEQVPRTRMAASLAQPELRSAWLRCLHLLAPWLRSAPSELQDAVLDMLRPERSWTQAMRIAVGAMAAQTVEAAALRCVREGRAERALDFVRAHAGVGVRAELAAVCASVAAQHAHRRRDVWTVLARSNSDADAARAAVGTGSHVRLLARALAAGLPADNAVREATRLLREPGVLLQPSAIRILVEALPENEEGDTGKMDEEDEEEDEGGKVEENKKKKNRSRRVVVGEWMRASALRGEGGQFWRKSVQPLAEKWPVHSWLVWPMDVRAQGESDAWWRAVAAAVVADAMRRAGEAPLFEPLVVDQVQRPWTPSLATEGAADRTDASRLPLLSSRRLATTLGLSQDPSSGSFVSLTPHSATLLSLPSNSTMAVESSTFDSPSKVSSSFSLEKSLGSSSSSTKWMNSKFSNPASSPPLVSSGGGGGSEKKTPQPFYFPSNNPTPPVFSSQKIISSNPTNPSSGSPEFPASSFTEPQGSSTLGSSPLGKTAVPPHVGQQRSRIGNSTSERHEVKMRQQQAKARAIQAARRRQRQHEARWRARTERAALATRLARQYRRGDYPDTQLRAADLLAPLLELVLRSTSVAQAVLNAHVRGLDGESREALTRGLDALAPPHAAFPPAGHGFLWLALLDAEWRATDLLGRPDSSCPAVRAVRRRLCGPLNFTDSALARILERTLPESGASEQRDARLLALAGLAMSQGDDEAAAARVALAGEQVPEALRRAARSTEPQATLEALAEVHGHASVLRLRDEWMSRSYAALGQWDRVGDSDPGLSAMAVLRDETACREARTDPVARALVALQRGTPWRARRRIREAASLFIRLYPSLVEADDSLFATQSAFPKKGHDLGPSSLLALSSIASAAWLSLDASKGDDWIHTSPLVWESVPWAPNVETLDYAVTLARDAALRAVRPPGGDSARAAGQRALSAAARVLGALPMAERAATRAARLSVDRSGAVALRVELARLALAKWEARHGDARWMAAAAAARFVEKRERAENAALQLCDDPQWRAVAQDIRLSALDMLAHGALWARDHVDEWVAALPASLEDGVRGRGRERWALEQWKSQLFKEWQLLPVEESLPSKETLSNPSLTTFQPSSSSGSSSRMLSWERLATLVEVDGAVSNGEAATVVVRAILRVAAEAEGPQGHSLPKVARAIRLLADWPESDVARVFAEEAAAVPILVFARWTPQLVALLRHPAALVRGSVATLLLRLARRSPAPLRSEILACFHEDLVHLESQSSEEPLSKAKKRSIERTVETSSSSAVGSDPEWFQVWKSIPQDPVETQFREALMDLTDVDIRAKDSVAEVEAQMGAGGDEARLQQAWVQLWDDLLSDRPGRGKEVRVAASQLRRRVLDALKPLSEADARSLAGARLRTKWAAVRKVLTAAEGPRRTGAELQPLQDYSEWLYAFHGEGAALGMPGTEWDEEPVRVTLAEPELLALRSIRRPKRVTLRGSDLRAYSYLVKGGEDLRQDQRVMAASQLMNALLQADVRCRRLALQLRVYRVLPLTPRLGLIEWMDDTATLKSALERSHSAALHLLSSGGLSTWQECVSRITHVRDSWLKTYAKERGVAGAERRPETYLRMMHSASRSVAVQKFAEVDLAAQRSLGAALARALSALGGTLAGQAQVQTRYARSLAVLSVAGYVLGVGDRHLENLLVDELHGGLVAIDFGHAFGSATQILPIPELMPFRLTRQLVDALGSEGVQARLRPAMARAIATLRAHRDVLLAELELCLVAPPHDWHAWAARLPKEAFASPADAAPAKRDRAFASQKLDSVRAKLTGVNPAEVLRSELAASVFASNPSLCRDLFDVAAGIPASNVRASLPDRCSVLEQVDSLIDLATDPNILARTYSGWLPWI